MNAVHLDSPEVEFAKEAARKYFMHLEQVSAESPVFTADMDHYCFTSGTPAMAALIPYVTAKRTRDLGAKVAISANGADELFFGYDRTEDKPTYKQVAHIFRSLYGNQYENSSLYGVAEKEPFALENGRWLELKTYVEYDLNSTLDFASMCHSVEVRSPFLNHKLVETALSMPKEMHVNKRFGGKAILKGMLSREGFSDAFLTRPKVGFSMYKEPAGLDTQRKYALAYLRSAGLIKLDNLKLSGRDHKYIEAAAFSLYRWLVIWRHKLKGYG
jgi:asparagine synthase (glutamine-hydrolysing)